jgi:hypothetical protein
VVGTITGDGHARVIVTCTGLPVTPLTTDVAVLNGDVVAVTAAKIAAALNETAVTNLFWITSSGADVILTKKIPAATIANLNIDINNEDCTGLTDAPTSADTHAGEAAFTPIAFVKNIGGPGLALDNEDVTTHDSTAAFEEVVPTVLRTGELSLDLVYDPNADTHDAGTGLAEMLESKTLVGFNLIFPGPYEWDFAAYVNGFEPGAPVDGALTATAKLKITGVPTLV